MRIKRARQAEQKEPTQFQLELRAESQAESIEEPPTQLIVATLGEYYVEPLIESRGESSPEPFAEHLVKLTTESSVETQYNLP